MLKVPQQSFVIPSTRAVLLTVNLWNIIILFLITTEKEMKKHRKPRRIKKEDYDMDDEMDGPVIEEALLTAKELLGLQQAEERLKRDYIYRLRKVTFLPHTCLFKHVN